MYARATLLVIVAALLVTVAPASAAPGGDIFINIFDDPDPVTAGGQITYTIAVGSNGPDATDVELAAAVPAGTTPVSATAGPGAACDQVTPSTTVFKCDLGTFSQLEFILVELVVQTSVSTTSPVTMVATITAGDDPSTGNNTATAKTAVISPLPAPGADLALTKADGPDPVGLGGKLTYTLSVTNAGPGSAAGVELVDDLPASAKLVSASSSQGSCVGSDPVSCDLGSLAKGAKATVTIVVEPTKTGPVLNTAFVFAAAPSDPATANNTASASTTIAPPAPAPSPPPSTPASAPPPLAPSASGAVSPPATPAAARDLAPPGKVTAVRATTGPRSVVLRWRSPSDSDFQRVVITRSSAGTSARIVYSGRGEEFTDRGLRNGVRYAYELRSVDRSGNSSSGVRFAATPKALPLFSPLPNARVASVPMLRWAAVRGASYYNVQLYRGSKKVLSAWPPANRLKLRERWTFLGRRELLAPGVYHWFVWPGRGPRSRSSYGPVLGQSSFVFVPAGR